jgi:hypothetical protein
MRLGTLPPARSPLAHVDSVPLAVRPVLGRRGVSDFLPVFEDDANAVDETRQAAAARA